MSTGSAFSTASSTPEPNEGSYYGVIDSGSSASESATYTFSSQPQNISFDIHPAGSFEEAQVRLRDSSNAAGPKVVVDGSGNVEADEGSGGNVDTGIDLTASSWFTLQLTNIDYSNKECDITVYNSSGRKVGSYHNAGFEASAGGTDNTRFISDNSDSLTYVDDVEVGAPPRKKTVSGYVTNESSGNAVEGATVQIDDSGGSQVADLTTDPSGYYTTSLGDGDYTITVEAPDYQTASTDDPDHTGPES